MICGFLFRSIRRYSKSGREVVFAPLLGQQHWIVGYLDSLEIVNINIAMEKAHLHAMNNEEDGELLNERR